jgi:hypothetical protein
MWCVRSRTRAVDWPDTTANRVLTDGVAADLRPVKTLLKGVCTAWGKCVPSVAPKSQCNPSFPAFDARNHHRQARIFVDNPDNRFKNRGSNGITRTTPELHSEITAVPSAHDRWRDMAGSGSSRASLRPGTAGWIGFRDAFSNGLSEAFLKALMHELRAALGMKSRMFPAIDLPTGALNDVVHCGC